jgi:DNA-binding NtrC family response regulator
VKIFSAAFCGSPILFPPYFSQPKRISVLRSRIFLWRSILDLPMTSQMKPKLLAIDTNRKTLLEISQTAAQWYEVVTTNDPKYALTLLNAKADFAVLICEHITGNFEGVSFLDCVRNCSPDTRRVVLSSYGDLSPLIHGLHTGAIQKLIQKPIVKSELLAAIVPSDVQAATAGNWLGRTG